MAIYNKLLTLLHVQFDLKIRTEFTSKLTVKIWGCESETNSTAGELARILIKLLVSLSLQYQPLVFTTCPSSNVANPSSLKFSPSTLLVPLLLFLTLCTPDPASLLPASTHAPGSGLVSAFSTSSVAGSCPFWLWLYLPANAIPFIL